MLSHDKKRTLMFIICEKSRGYLLRLVTLVVVAKHPALSELRGQKYVSRVLGLLFWREVKFVSVFCSN